MATLAPKLPYTHPFAGGYPYRGSARLPSDPDALTYLAAVAAADGAPVETAVAVAVDDFFKGCKADGIWDAIKASCILCGARTLAGALVPLAGTAPSNNNFVSGDYNRETGLKGNGSTKYLDTGRAPNEDPQNDAHISVYITGQNTLSVVRYAGVTDLPVSTSLMLYDDNTFTAGYINSSTLTDVANRTAINFFGAARSDSANQTARVDGVSATTSIASVAPSELNSYVFCRNLNGTANLFTDARFAFYSIGESLDLASLDARVTALVQRIQLSLSTGLDASGYDDATVAYLLAAYNNGATLE